MRVTFPDHRPLASTTLYCLMTDASASATCPGLLPIINCYRCSCFCITSPFYYFWHHLFTFVDIFLRISYVHCLVAVFQPFIKLLLTYFTGIYFYTKPIQLPSIICMIPYSGFLYVCSPVSILHQQSQKWLETKLENPM